MNANWRKKSQRGYSNRERFRSEDWNSIPSEQDSLERPSFNDQQQRTRHPPHLRGKEIGMFYARRNREKQKKTEGPEKISLNQIEEKKITNLLHRIQSDDCGSYSKVGTNNFHVEYNNHMQSKVMSEIGYNPVTDGIQADPVLDKCLMQELEQRNNNTAYQKMLTFRKKLPSFHKQQEIVHTICENQVVVISGETGCGKTTQVSQFLLDSYIRQGKGSQCHIVCTQPRRISAISVAERVADERAEQCGGEKSSIGWQIRLESRIPRPKGSILYCTTGIVLQWLKKDRLLQGLSHIILDEIHERDLDSDFLMIILKDLLPLRPDLKLILMSATLNSELFSKYFFKCPMVHIPGYTFPVEELYLEDILEKTGYEPIAKDKVFNRRSMWKKSRTDNQEQDIMGPFIRSLSGSYSRRTINTLSEWNESIIELPLIVSLLKHICLREKEGAVLIFLPGWADISKLHNLLNDDYMFNSNRFLLVPLHSMMPTVNQREVFNAPPRGVRKIIIATNIAETSITIDDVVFVIDCGFIKMENFNIKENVSTLKPEWVALANARQRRGRAGRVQPGICYKLYTRAREMTFEQYCLPEMLRTRLETLCLKIKILKQGNIERFLTKAMNPPAIESVTLSIDLLKKLNALDAEELLTPLGFHLARLPMDPQTGKMILFGAIFGCLDPILSVAASLTFKDAFVIPLGKEDLVDTCKCHLSENSQSDHLMLANAIHLWEEACHSGNGQQFCWENFLSSNTLKMLSNLKKQFAEYLQGLHFLHCSDPKHKDFNRNSGNIMLLKAVIAAGLYPNVAKLKRTKACGKKGRAPALITPDGKVSIHPKSVANSVKNFSTPWVVYYQKVKSTQVYLHDLTIVHPYALLFFGGHLKIGQNGTDTTLSVEDWITFSCPERVAELIPALRKELDALLEHKVNFPGVTDWKPNSKEGAVLQSIVDLLSSEDSLNSIPPSNYYPEHEHFEEFEDD